MPTIDEMIQAAREQAKNAEGEDKARAQARAEALLEMKSEGYTKTDTEVGGIVKRNRDEASAESGKWSELVGMDYAAAEKLFSEMNDGSIQSLLSGDSEDGDGDGEGEERPMIERVSSLLEDRDARINDLSSCLDDVNKRYATDKVETAIRDRFREAGLDDSYLDPAKRLASYDDLVEKAAKGGDVTADEIAAKVDGVKELSGVWFGSSESSSDGDSNGGRTLPGGFKLKEEAISIGIPATPNGRVEANDMTEEDRAARATSVY